MFRGIAGRFALVVASLVVTATLATAQLPTGPQLLVDATWLNQHLHDANLVVLTVGPEPGYAKEHIPGSQFILLDDLSTPMPWPKPAGWAGLNLEMPAESQLRTALEQRGISNASRIVVVADSEWNSPSTRVLLTLGYVGLGDRAFLLDGGMSAWRKAGYKVTGGRTSVVPGHLVTALLPSVIVDADYVSAHKNASRVKLIDARDTVFFNRPRTDKRSGGHVPGATNLPFASLIAPGTNRYLAKSELEQRFRAAGVQPGDTVVAYCHVGQQATLVLFAARLLGHPTKLYDGSFEDWSNRKLPTEGGN